MTRFRAFATQTPALVISAIALTLSLGGGAYAAAQLASATQQVSLHNLTLINGWHSSNSIYHTGNPRVGILNGVVYLAGSMHQSTPGNADFAVLPHRYRPAHNLYITFYTNAGTSGWLYIGSNGIMESASNTSCGTGDTSQCYTSLANISYPVKS
jgi:hypothetical protein